MAPTPSNPALYEAVKKEAKQKFAVWPSAYASGWLVKTYKDRGGTYTTPAKNTTQKPLQRWFEEKWVDVCHYLETGKWKVCGRPKGRVEEKYPYCRPSKRISPNTPKTVHEMDRRSMQERCATKRLDPSTRAKRA
jgi:Family of unknown function (DUF5872)